MTRPGAQKIERLIVLYKELAKSIKFLNPPTFPIDPFYLYTMKKENPKQEAGK
jgi:hypothetical protein